MILQQLNGGSMKSVVQKIIAQEGVPGIFKASLPTIWREGLYGTALFGLSDLVDHNMRKVIPHSGWSKAASYLATGAAVGALTTPLNTVKTAMQEELGPSSIKRTVTTIVQKKGVQGLVAGGGWRMALVGGLMLVVGKAKDTCPAYFPAILYTS